MLLTTKRLTLDDYTIDDVSDYYKLKSCAPVWRYSTFAPLDEEAQAKEALAKLIESAKQNLPVFSRLMLTASHEYIGEAGIIARNNEAARCVVGYNLLPGFWGNGYATEITGALIRHAFEEWKMERVEALVQKENAASRRVLEKSGLLLEGVLRHYAKIWGEYADICCYGIIAGDYFDMFQLDSD
jgi:[ribosomal protein S5]-alanine N-acetyltransferase